MVVTGTDSRTVPATVTQESVNDCVTEFSAPVEYAAPVEAVLPVILLFVMVMLSKLL